MAVPIIGSGGRLIGAINIESDTQHAYAPLSLSLLSLLASGVGGAIERTTLHADILKKRRLEHEVAVAGRVMSSLLPTKAPELPGFEIDITLRPWREVGGDYYDVIPIDHERCAIVVADVAGKGIPAALLVSALKASLHSLVGNQLAIRSILNKLNLFFHEVSPEARYATLFFAELDILSRRMIYVNAGHLPPGLIRSDGDLELLETGGTPVGLFPEARFMEGVAGMEAGDLLVLYTDGIVEAENERGEEYGWERLRDVLYRSRSLPCSEVRRAVLEDQERFTAGEPTDDRTLVIVRSL
jgi:sigma-B regulation protein RsbU (phosphoserine phosphatase)